jgi:hypothetical protein
MKTNKESTQNSERKAYWQIFPSSKYWKKTPNISQELNLLKPKKQDDKERKT